VHGITALEEGGKTKPQYGRQATELQCGRASAVFRTGAMRSSWCR
jgi:hypothetical protein